MTPDFLEVGDFNADGKKDVLALSKSDNRLQLLFGDGRGNFSEPVTVLLPGTATALAVGEIGQADGQTDIAIAVRVDKGAQLLVFAYPEGAFKPAPEVIPLTGTVTDLAIGNLDGDGYADIAVAAGKLLTIVHGRGQAYPWDMIKSLNIKRPPAVGDASYDGRNYLGLGEFDLLPTKLLDTNLMETASDDWFADFNNDGVPELAVGRLPFRNPTEAATIIGKLVGYYQSPASDEVLLVADRNDGFNFEQASTQLVGTIPSSLRTNQINRGQVGTATAKAQMLETIKRGQKVINYAGHGSVNGWRDNLLKNEDATQMENADHLSVFVMMSCLNGYFDDPMLDSLAESLLKAEKGGAVAVWASSLMTLPGVQAEMNRELYRSLFSGETAPRLGEATRAAKSKVTDLDIRRTWILIGDPSLRIR